MGEEGFSSDSSLLYHRGVPSAIVDSRGLGAARPGHDAEPPAQAAAPQAARRCSTARRRRPATPSTGRRLVLGNGDVRISYVVAGPSPRRYYRNAIGDECVYVESGARHRRDRLRRAAATGPATTCDPAGDHAPLGAGASEPALRRSRRTATSRRRSATSRASASCSSTRRTASATCTARPSRSCSSRATGRRGAGQAPRQRPGGVVGTRMTYATHPFDVVGWDGCLYPYTFNVDDYMPITGKVHQPPPVHQVFEGHNFVVCNFVPRKVDYHPLSIPVPYYHSNVDSRRGHVLRRRRLRGPQGLRHRASARSRCTPAATRTARSRPRSRRRSARTTSTSRRSWSTPSARSTSARAASRPRTRRTPGPGRAAAATTAGRTAARRCSPTRDVAAPAAYRRSCLASSSCSPACCSRSSRRWRSPLPSRSVTNLTPPTADGTAAYRSRLVADPGTWSATAPTYTYQWLRDGRDIAAPPGRRTGSGSTTSAPTSRSG